MLSIILPSLNRYEYVVALLNDLEQQTYKDFELIIVDQSSQKYRLPSSSFPINHLPSEAKGPCNAKNIGARASSGELLLFLDDDIRFASNFIELLITPIENSWAEVTVACICNKDGEYLFDDYQSHLKRSPFILQNIMGNPHCPGMFQADSISAGCTAMKRNCFFDLDGFDEFYDPNGASEDRDFALRLQHKGYRMLYVGDAKLIHLDAGSGGRRDIDPNRTFDVFKYNMGYTIHKHFGSDAFLYYKVQLAFFYYQKIGLLSREFWRLILYLKKWRFDS